MKNKDYLALISTQKSHIATLLAIIRRLQDDMKLALETKYEDEKNEILVELIYWIDKLMEYEK